MVARIAQVMRAASGAPPAGSVWIGDDAAVVPAEAGALLLATDAAVAGVHADLGLVGVDDLGWKALTATVSDLGAMGGRPRYALVTACLPPRTDVELLSAGIAAASARWGCPVVGGDVTSADQLMVSVAAVGVLDGDPVTRAGARPGDMLVLTGPLGASAAGLRLLRAMRQDPAQEPGRQEPGRQEPGRQEPGQEPGRQDPDRPASGPAREGDGARGAEGAVGEHLVEAHRRPVARIEEGVAARAAGATAMIDVSDGLALDLHRLADASGVGFRLDRVPVADGATEEEALGGGEDYELLVATPHPDRLAEEYARAGLRPPLVVGVCTGVPEERTCRGRPLARLGWAHRVG